MSTQVLRGAAQKKKAEELMKKKPIVILFFMDGCGHCEANKPAWDKFKKMMGGTVEIAEVESEATPDSSGVTGFPTMVYVDATGAKKEISGAKSSPEDIAKELGIQKKGGLRVRRRSHATRRRNHRRDRKLRHRTLRNNVPLV